MSNIVLFVKQAFTKNRFITLNMTYLLLVVWFKSAVFVLYDVCGLIMTITGLLFFPLCLVIGRYAYRWIKTPKSRRGLTTVRELSEHQLFLLRKNVPTAQLEVVNNVLLLSIGLLHDLLLEIKIPEANHSTLFDQKFQQLLVLFKNIKNRSEFLNSTIGSRSINNAIICFAFYRILFDDVLTQAINQSILSKDVDPWILMKRVSPRMALYLGSQSWRIYELKTLLLGDLATLEMNIDIKDILISVCDEILMPCQLTSSHEVVEIPVENTSPLQLEKINVTKNLNSFDIPSVEDTEDSILIPEEPKQENQEFDKEEDHPILANKLIKWIQRQTVRYPINQAERFFVDIKIYGKEKLFISDIGLSDFAKKDQISIEDLKFRLLNSQDESNCDYHLVRENQQSISLLRLDISFDVDVMHPLNGEINEVNP